MAKSDIDAFLPLRTNWFHILLSLSGQEQHGYGIMNEVLERSGGKIRLWPATLAEQRRGRAPAQQFGPTRARRVQ